MKRLLTVLFSTLLLTATLCVTASASDFDNVAQELSAIGMFRGTENGFELDRAPTRNEAAIMLVRLCGEEESIQAAYNAGEIKHPFTDVSDFASPYVAWLYTNGITKGTSATTFSSQVPCSAQSYAVFLLRTLGYEEGKDFLYADAAEFAMSKGMFDPSLIGGDFLRDDLAALTYQALACKMADGEHTLLEHLIESGAIDEEDAKPITSKLDTYQTLMATEGISSTASIDAGINMNMDMTMDMSMDDAGTPMTYQTAANLNAKGTVQSIMNNDDIQLGLKLNVNMTMSADDPETGATVNSSIPMEMGLWIKDNWVYISDGTTSYKEPLDNSVAEFGEMMKQLNSLNDLSMSMLLPYITDIKTERNGSDTIYTLDINDGAFSNFFNDLLSQIFSEMGIAELGGDTFTLQLDSFDCSYTVGRNGLKKENTKMGLTMGMNMMDPETGKLLFSEAIAMKADVEVIINRIGSSVRVSYPDLSRFEERSVYEGAELEALA